MELGTVFVIWPGGDDSCMARVQALGLGVTLSSRADMCITPGTLHLDMEKKDAVYGRNTPRTEGV